MPGSQEFAMAEHAGNVDTTGETRALVSRAYQLEMFERAKEANLIVCMDTGSGKTQIARLLIDYELQRQPSALVWFLTQSQVLAEQQHTFLSSQLPAYSFRLITGLDNAEYWASRNVWEAALRSKHGVISTAQVLLDALSHDFVSLDTISLLVLDEAHHCVGKNPYRKIMRLQTEQLQEQKIRKAPHILGLTATAMIRDDLKLIGEVEANMSAICQTPTKTIEQYRGFVHLPTLTRLAFSETKGKGSILIPLIETLIREYRMEDDPTIARLEKSSNAHDQQKLEKILLRSEPPVVYQLTDMLKKAIYLEEVLGSWASDRYIHACVSKLVASAEQQRECLFTINLSEVVHLANLLTPVLKVVVSKQNLAQHLTPKVRVLLEYMQTECTASVTCVIFVQRRTVAYALQDILSQSPVFQKFQPFTFVGSSNPLNRNLADLADLSAQQTAFADFRAGKRNICVATQVLEEGIDVQACNLVICFDPPLTAKSYIQRRGRARKLNGVFVLMHPTHEPVSKHSNWVALEAEMKRIYAEENRCIEEQRARQAQVHEQMRLGAIRCTKATVDVDSARQHLQFFCQTMRRGYEEPPLPLYLLKYETASRYSCKVVLPSALPPRVRVACSSSAWPSETQAKKDAAFQAYKQLQDAGLLNEHLLPIHAEVRRKERRGRVTETRESTVEISPCLDIWALSRNRLAERGALYASKVSIPGQPAMLLLLPFRLLRTASCKLYTVSGGEMLVSVHSTASIFGSIHRTAIRITKFLFHTVLQRRLPGLERDDYLLPYYLVPDLAEHEWECWLSMVQKTTPLPEFDFSGCSEILLTKCRENIPYFYHRQNDACKEIEHGTLDVVRLPRTIDFSTKHQQLQPMPASKAVTTQGCLVSGLAPGFARMVAYMPTVVHSVELALRAQTALATVLQGIDLDQSAAVVDAFIGPMAAECNYQRLEYLGDAVLKYMAAINVFCNNVFYTEGALSVAMDRLITNARLHESTLQLGLDKFLTTEAFSGRSWTLAAKTSASRHVSTKTLADVIEALLGVAYQHTGCTNLQRVVKSLSLFLPEITWRTPEEDIAGYPTDELPPNLSASHFEDVQKLIGYRFRRPVLLAEALNHSSPHLSLRSYDRLEFLGDAIIDLVVKEALFKSSHEFDEASMTLARHAIVNKEIFAFLATRTCILVRESNPVVDLRSKRTTINEATTSKHLHDYLSRQPSPQLASQRVELLRHYAAIEARVAESLTTGKDWPWADLLQLNSPKWASDVLESIIGAVFIDSGASLASCRAVLDRFGLMRLVERAVREPDLRFRQQREVLRLAMPGKVKFESKRYRDDSDGYYGKGEGDALVWRCVVSLDGEVAATAGACSCEAEAEERAAVLALQTLELATAKDQVDAVGDFKKEEQREKDSVMADVIRGP